MQEADQNISVIGLGKLGAPIAAAWAARGFNVIGVDNDPQKADAINNARPPVHEPGLADLLRQTAGRLTATTDVAHAVHNSSTTFIIVPTPSEQDGRFSLNFVLPVVQQIGRALANKPGRHLVVLTSTVMPGDTAGPVRETLEAAGGLRVGKDVGLCYSPEFVALGSVIHDFLNQELVLIGQHDQQSGDRLESLVRRVVTAKPSVVRLNLVNAELAKLAVNTYVTTKITFANMLASICHRLPGADVDAVTDAIGLDPRIGQRYLRGGLGYGGPCFPRDNVAMSALARGLEADAGLADAVDNLNRRSTLHLVGWIKTLLSPGDTVAVLGLSYKPDSDVVEESQGLLLACLLDDERVPVVAYDPVASEPARRRLPHRVKIAPTLQDAIAAADVLVVATPWDEFRNLTGLALARLPRQRVVIDCWRCLDARRIEPHTRYVALGRGPDEPTHGSPHPVTSLDHHWAQHAPVRLRADQRTA